MPGYRERIALFKSQSLYNLAKMHERRANLPFCGFGSRTTKCPPVDSVHACLASIFIVIIVHNFSLLKNGMVFIYTKETTRQSQAV